ncbi:hypothetical protein [Fimbriiglobus ruber]|uniref:Uncharacterized protein n=1 Tax=Fimbriiglobus ruber TaxID=1908690 RepID=A0A225E791_9BACT|nr:hypothetical protein [Fimbriiglobus ruber]OWK45379.1 hypothetical protein FRUB_01710 [Fimbriiglobus ruber]
MDEPVEVIFLVGFDPEGEPQIRCIADGSLFIVFNFMPPSWAEYTPERFDNFDRQLAVAIGVNVEWEDREVFRIQTPAPDTVTRVREFLGAYRKSP